MPGYVHPSVHGVLMCSPESPGLCDSRENMENFKNLKFLSWDTDIVSLHDDRCLDILFHALFSR